MRNFNYLLRLRFLTYIHIWFLMNKNLLRFGNQARVLHQTGTALVYVYIFIDCVGIYKSTLQCIKNYEYMLLRL